jgi:hypothetical protein
MTMTKYFLAALGSLFAMVFAARPAAADEGGVSFWLPGQFGSFAAVPSTPGLTLPVIYYHYSGSAGADTLLPRGGSLTAGLDVDIDLGLFAPSYALEPQILWGQLSFGVAAFFGHAAVGVDATLMSPRGNTFANKTSDTVTGFGDLYPTAQLHWNNGVVNALWYVMGGVPVGAYDAEQLANLGTNHWSIDMGGGFTYFDTKAGHEFSLVVGDTYNFANPDTHYRNGVSIHADASLSQFLSESIHIGLVGYLYNQLTGDDAPAPLPSGLKSRIYAAGLQLGWFFNIGKYQPYLNLKGYYEFSAKNRPEGWNLWLLFAFPCSAATG